MVVSFAALRQVRIMARIVPALLALSLALATGAKAQDAPSDPSATAASQKAGEKGGGAKAPAGPSATEQHRLPPDSTTKQTVVLPGRTLAFTATAGSIRLFDDKGEAQADIAYTAYQLDGADVARRPVTFLFNGGPDRKSVV